MLHFPCVRSLLPLSHSITALRELASIKLSLCCATRPISAHAPGMPHAEMMFRKLHLTTTYPSRQEQQPRHFENIATAHVMLQVLSEKCITITKSLSVSCLRGFRWPLFWWLLSCLNTCGQRLSHCLFFCLQQHLPFRALFGFAVYSRLWEAEPDAANSGRVLGCNCLCFTTLSVLLQGRSAPYVMDIMATVEAVAREAPDFESVGQLLS